MRLMPIYQKPNTSNVAKRHKDYPYLRRGLRVDRPNPVWWANITYLPMRHVNAEVKFPRCAEVIFPTFGIW